MRKRLLLVVLATLPILAVPSFAASPAPPSITVSASTTSRPDTVMARISVCPEGDTARCYQLLRRVTRGEAATLNSFLSLETSPLPSLLGELSITADGKSLDYRLEFVSGVLPVASVAGLVSLTPE